MADGLMKGPPRPGPFGRIMPLRPGPDWVQVPVDHLKVVALPVATAVDDRQERSRPFAFGGCQMPRSMSISAIRARKGSLGGPVESWVFI
jgi:hypothetical protein